MDDLMMPQFGKLAVLVNERGVNSWHLVVQRIMFSLLERPVCMANAPCVMLISRFITDNSWKSRCKWRRMGDNVIIDLICNLPVLIMAFCIRRNHETK